MGQIALNKRDQFVLGSTLFVILPDLSGNLLHSKSQSTVDYRYLEIEGTLKNSSRYPYFDISDLYFEEKTM